MECNCRWTESVIAIVILVFTFWNTVTWGKWVVAIAATVLLVHSFSCKNCCAFEMKGRKGRR